MLRGSTSACKGSRGADLRRDDGRVGLRAPIIEEKREDGVQADRRKATAREKRESFSTQSRGAWRGRKKRGLSAHLA